jgi:hypothetical protein
MPEDRDPFAETEEQRQASQAGAHQAQRRAEAENAGDRAALAEEDAALDPNSPEGRQAAIRRGDPVQLRGEEEAQGMVRGTSTTTNESGAGFPATDEHRFVTGAAGFPVPESAGVPPQRPGDFDPDAEPRDMSMHPDVQVPPQEQGFGYEGPDEAAVAEETPESRAAGQAQSAEPSPGAQQVGTEENAEAVDAQRAEAEEARQAEQANPREADADTGEHGPGTTQ